MASWKAGGRELEAVPIVAGGAGYPGGSRWRELSRWLKVAQGGRGNSKIYGPRKWHIGKISQGGAEDPVGLEFPSVETTRFPNKNIKLRS